MQAFPIPPNESSRICMFDHYQILDTEPEVAFDDLTTLASALCNAPVALISLINAQRQWFKSRVGLDVTETPREVAFCSYTILRPDILIVPDALDDPKFATNPLVTNEPHIRFYAGVPLITPEGYPLGTLCVIDFVPRELSSSQIESLKALGRQVMAQLELRRKLIETEKLMDEALHREAVLQESEERFRVIADSIPVLLWMEDINRCAVFHNKAWLRFTGQTLDSEVDEEWQKGIHPDDRQHWLEIYTSAFNARTQYTLEYRLRRADGEYCWLLEIGVPRFLSDGIFEGFTRSCVDITTRKEAELDSQLLKNVAYAIAGSPDFSSALEAAIQKICEATQWEFGEAWVPNLSTNMMECSPAWYSKTKRLQTFRQESETFQFPRRVGIPGRIWASRQIEWHQDISAESNSTYLRAQLALDAGLKATLGIPLLANDEVIAVLVFYMFEPRFEDQRMIDLISASTELGLFIQRKQVEEEMKKSLAREQELNQFKSNFLANVSHELRTPLTCVLGLSNVLLQQHLGTLNPEQHQYLSVIHQNGEHLLSLISDLLDLAKIEAGKQELYLERINIAELCQSAIEMVEVKAAAKQQMLYLDLPIAAESVVADPQRILQILLNYLSNSIKFTADGETITLTTRLASGAELKTHTLPPENLDLSPITSDSRFLVLEVSDPGVGIPLEKQYLLFRSFQQIETSDRHYEGSGLGLTLSKQLAELHGGRVSFQSIPGVGSVFSVWLSLEKPLDVNPLEL